MTSIATLNRMTAKKLADLLLEEAQQEVEAQAQAQGSSEGRKESKIAIVDVRDDGEFCLSILQVSFWFRFWFFLLSPPLFLDWCSTNAGDGKDLCRWNPVDSGRRSIVSIL